MERALGALTGQRDDYETIRGLVCLRHPYGVKPRGLYNALLEGVGTGDIRTDVPSDELANYCLHALTAAGRLPSKAAVRRLASVTLAGLRPGPSSTGVSEQAPTLPGAEPTA